ncbi:MAG: hypothetical protein LIO58_00940 [Oscillospiraceae bacterium]|nr:hypothetical protein [Oscillospiraceae bacterium]
MSISAHSEQKAQVEKAAYGYLLFALLCALFGAVYEQFSHEVYSAYMIYAFAFPLALGALPLFTLARAACRRLPGKRPLALYRAGIVTLTIGSLLQGVLDIYGTTNALLRVYWLAGLALAVAGIVWYCCSFVLVIKE